MRRIGGRRRKKFNVVQWRSEVQWRGGNDATPVFFQNCLTFSTSFQSLSVRLSGFLRIIKSKIFNLISLGPPPSRLSCFLSRIKYNFCHRGNKNRPSCYNVRRQLYGFLSHLRPRWSYWGVCFTLINAVTYWPSYKDESLFLMILSGPIDLVKLRKYIKWHHKFGEQVLWGLYSVVNTAALNLAVQCSAVQCSIT